MNLSSYCLVLGAAASFFNASLHVALAIRPQLWRYCGAGELTHVHEQGSPFAVLAALGLALMFAAWGAYALSGAGVIGQLPLLRAALIAIGVIYVLRSLMLPSEVVEFFKNGHSFRFIVFSTGSLAMGLFYLLGSSAR
jgi:hypothetical protein